MENKDFNFIYNLIKEKNILSLSDCQGSCPCGRFYIRGINVDFHCWRNNCGICKFSGIHIKSHYDFNYSKEELNQIGQLCLEQIKEIWFNTDWDLIIEDSNT